MEKKDYHQIRKDFQKGGLDKDTCPADPVILMKDWLDNAITSEVPEPTSMILSTVGMDNRPSSRVVLLKGLDKSGLHFFTNYQSRKSDELSDNPWVAGVLFWAALERQIRVEGYTEKLNAEESDQYFFSRPEDSMINAIISPQSQQIANRDFLLKRRESFLQKLHTGQTELKRPDYWGGYVIIPNRIEFWQGRPGRLHDRIVYSKKKSKWSINRLAP